MRPPWRPGFQWMRPSAVPCSIRSRQPMRAAGVCSRCRSRHRSRDCDSCEPADRRLARPIHLAGNLLAEAALARLAADENQAADGMAGECCFVVAPAEVELFDEPAE